MILTFWAVLRRTNQPHEHIQYTLYAVKPHCMGTHVPTHQLYDNVQSCPECDNSSLHTTSAEDKASAGIELLDPRVPGESSYSVNFFFITSPYPPANESHLTSSHLAIRAHAMPRRATQCHARTQARAQVQTPSDATHHHCTYTVRGTDAQTTSRYLLACSAACCFLHSVVLSTKS